MENGGNFKRWGLIGLPVIGDMSLKRIVRPQLPFLTLLLAMRGRALLYHVFLSSPAASPQAQKQ
jgi:hypothetical protein